MIIEVLDKHYGGLTTLKEIIEWYGIRAEKNNTNKIVIRFRKKDNDMYKIKNAVMLRIFDKGKVAYIPIMQIFDKYSDDEAEIIGNFELVREDNLNE